MAAAVTVFDNRVCELGEGPLWRPERGQLFWFDINGKRMLSRDETGRWCQTNSNLSLFAS
jgi:sugar lactone lactonase YvrE